MMKFALTKKRLLKFVIVYQHVQEKFEKLDKHI